jgi:hypothetical protein
MNSDRPENNAPETGDNTGTEIPNGAAAAAILSAGICCFSLSLLGWLGDLYPPMAHFFVFYTPTGPLSGVTTTAIIIWLFSWTLLSGFWGGKDLSLGKINGIAIVLLVAGLLLGFPPIGDFLQGK